MVALDLRPRAVPMLACLVAEGHPGSKDHGIVLHRLAALGVIDRSERPGARQRESTSAVPSTRTLRALKEQHRGSGESGTLMAILAPKERPDLGFGC